jgi:hypothetical protein
MKKTLSAVLLTAVIAAIIISSPLIFGLLSNSITLSSEGTLKTVGVGAYWDAACTNEITTLNWGIVEAASTKNVLIYLKNEGSTLITLSLNVTNWNPTNAPTYISIGWNYGGQQIASGNAIAVTLTLTVAGSVSDINNFTCDITITGSG